MKRHLMVLIILLFVATSSWGAGFTGLDRIWMQDATLNGSANQYWGTVDAFLEANELDNAGNAVLATLNATGSAGLSAGTAGSLAGNLNLKSGNTAFYFDFRANGVTSNYIWTIPTAQSPGAGYLVTVGATGLMSYTNPATLGGAPAFSDITAATNTTAAMVVGTGASLAVSGSGTIVASTATALVNNPTNCTAGNYPLGVDANGDVEGCTTASGAGDMTAAVYDAAAITEQLVGLTASQTLTNKTLSGSDFIAGATTNNTLGATTRTATTLRMGLGSSMATISVTVVSGTSALGTALIASGACATTVTTSATGMATTDVAMWGFNGDPTAVTGYAPTADGMLTIISWPSANNINFDVCNLTAAGITPGAITLNWRVLR